MSQQRAAPSRPPAERPPWAYDEDLIDALAVAHLGRFCGAVGLGRALGWTRVPDWWGGPRAPDGALALHDLRWRDQRSTLVLLARPGADWVLCLHAPTGEWREPSRDRGGQTFLSLAAERWGISETKAAWRWARLCGHPAPRAGG